MLFPLQHSFAASSGISKAICAAKQDSSLCIRSHARWARWSVAKPAKAAQAGKKLVLQYAYQSRHSAVLRPSVACIEGSAVPLIISYSHFITDDTTRSSKKSANKNSQPKSQSAQDLGQPDSVPAIRTDLLILFSGSHLPCNYDITQPPKTCQQRFTKKALKKNQLTPHFK